MKISVALCTFNGFKYLTKQIDSILNQQGVVPDEIIICDDISLDDTLKILTEYKTLYPNIFKIYVNEINLGSTKNFEKAISLCSGDFIFLSDQDDIWDENKIEKTLAVFKKNPNAEGVFSNAQLIDNKDKVFTELSLWKTIFFLENELNKPIDLLDIITKNGNIVTGATLCIKKQVKNYVLPLPIDVVLHDEWIATILAINQTLYYSTEKLISYRIHSNQQIGIKKINKIKKLNSIKRIILGLEKPKKFIDYRILIKKYFLQKSRLEKIESYNLEIKSLKELIIISSNNFIRINIETKAQFPIQYLLTNLVDKILGKRQLKN
jgi:glycosyltransferase involved in cell wall biosynthesis